MKININKFSVENLKLLVENIEIEFDSSDIMDISGFIIDKIKNQEIINPINLLFKSKENDKIDEEKSIPIATDRVTRILNATGPHRELVLNLINEAKQILTSANNTTPRRLLDPMNQLAIFYKLDSLDNLKSKKSMSETERSNSLQLINNTFLDWLGIDIIVSENINEVFRTKVIIDAIETALIHII